MRRLVLSILFGFTAAIAATAMAQATWVLKAPMPTARASFGAGAIDGVVYAAGGTVFPSCAALATLEAYDPVSDTWTTKAPMPTPRYHAAVAVLGGQLYVIGGGNNCSGAMATVEA